MVLIMAVMLLVVFFSGCVTEPGITTGDWSHEDIAGTKVKLTGYVDLGTTEQYDKFWFEWDSPENKISATKLYYRSFTTVKENLIRTNTYRYRAGATLDSNGETHYGDWRNCTPGFPDVETQPVDDYGLTWAYLNGELTHLGGATTCEVWFEYGTSLDNMDEKTINQTLTSTGKFGADIGNLTSCATYYYRAIVSNDVGEKCGEINELTPGLPDVETESATEISYNSAYLNGELTHLGGATTCEVWFEYGTSLDNMDEKTISQTLTSTDVFGTQISGLLANTTYCFRAVADNFICIGYGENKSFTTLE